MEEQKEHDLSSQNEPQALIYCKTGMRKNSFWILNAQQEKCLKFASDKDITVRAGYWDKGSANNMKRYGLNQILKMCRDKKYNIKYLIVERLDRLVHKLSDFLQISEELKNLGVRILTVSEPNDFSPTGEFRRNLLMAMSQYHNEIISESIKKGIQKRKEQQKCQI